jgi:trk system potassium uptake protein
MDQPNEHFRVCIVGCGRVGAQLAIDFDKQGYDSIVVDVNADAFLRLPEKNDFRIKHSFIGDGTDPTFLEHINAHTVDVFIAVTNGDNRNILAAQIAQRKFKIPHVICRIYDPKRHKIYRDLGLQSICPTLLGAKAIMKMLEMGDASGAISGIHSMIPGALEAPAPNGNAAPATPVIKSAPSAVLKES